MFQYTHIQLLDEDITQIVNSLSNESQDIYQESQEFFDAAKRVVLPSNFINALEIFKTNNNNLLLIEGIPIDHNIECGYKKTTSISEILLLKIASLLGEPLINTHHKQESVINDIYPALDDKCEQLGSSSRVPLTWHTESAHMPILPKYILLLCLRGNENAVTKCAFFDKQYLSSSELSILENTNCNISSDNSYTVTTNFTTPLLFSSDGNNNCLRYDPLYTNYNNQVIDKILKKLNKNFDKNSVSFTLKPQDMLIINNYSCVHARSKFNATHDSKDRWLKRVLVKIV